jgi:hypothetical protein
VGKENDTQISESRKSKHNIRWYLFRPSLYEPRITKHLIKGTYCIAYCWSQWPRGLRHWSTAARLLGLWIRIPPGHGCLSDLSVVCCQVEVSATGWSLVQRSPTYCDASLCVIYSRNLKNEEALASVGPQRHRQKKMYCLLIGNFESLNYELTSQWGLHLNLNCCPGRDDYKFIAFLNAFMIIKCTETGSKWRSYCRTVHPKWHWRINILAFNSTVCFTATQNICEVCNKPTETDFSFCPQKKAKISTFYCSPCLETWAGIAH